MKRNRLKRKGKPTRLAFFKPQLDAKTYYVFSAVIWIWHTLNPTIGC